MMSKRNKILLSLYLIFIIAAFSQQSLLFKTYSSQDLGQLTEAIYSEASHLPKIQKIAIGSVLINRRNSKDFPDNFSDIIHEAANQTPCQFSIKCHDNILINKEDSSWINSQKIAKNLLREKYNDPTKGALYFKENYDATGTFKNKQAVQIGNYIFYK